jgi:hypothetical protein
MEAVPPRPPAHLEEANGYTSVVIASRRWSQGAASETPSGPVQSCVCGSARASNVSGFEVHIDARDKSMSTTLCIHHTVGTLTDAE